MRSGILFGGMMLFAATLAQAQPKLEIEGGNTYDWGRVKPGDSPLKALIVLKNTGDQPLVIKEVRPGCGCTSAPISKHEIGSGDTASIQVSLNTGTAAGTLRKHITITSNDPVQASLSLGLLAEVYSPLRCIPAKYFAFDNLVVGQQSAAELTIKNLSDGDITLSDFTVPEGLTLDIPDSATIGAGQEMVLRALYTPKKKGYYNDRVSLRTSSADYPVLEIPLYGNVIEPRPLSK